MNRVSTLRRRRLRYIYAQLIIIMARVVEWDMRWWWGAGERRRSGKEDGTTI